MSLFSNRFSVPDPQKKSLLCFLLKRLICVTQSSEYFSLLNWEIMKYWYDPLHSPPALDPMRRNRDPCFQVWCQDFSSSCLRIIIKYYVYFRSPKLQISGNAKVYLFICFFTLSISVNVIKVGINTKNLISFIMTGYPLFNRQPESISNFKYYESFESEEDVHDLLITDC